MHVEMPSNDGRHMCMHAHLLKRAEELYLRPALLVRVLGSAYDHQDVRTLFSSGKETKEALTERLPAPWACAVVGVFGGTTPAMLTSCMQRKL